MTLTLSFYFVALTFTFTVNILFDHNIGDILDLESIVNILHDDLDLILPLCDLDLQIYSKYSDHNIFRNFNENKGR